MYKNSGAKVKGLATTLTTLMMIGCIIAGVVVMASGYRGSGTIPGLLIIVVGCIVAWLSGLMMAAFGELVENTYHIRKMLEEKSGNVAQAEKPAEKPVYADASVTPAEINAVMQRDGVPYGEAVVVAKKEKAAGPKVTNTDTSVCPNCGSPRKGNSTFCGYCGTRLQ